MKSLNHSNHGHDQRPSELGIFQSSQKRRLICCLLLALTTIALYAPVTRAPFLNFDDGVYVTANPQVRAGLSWTTVVWAFRTSEATNWHPITWLSHALDCQIVGMNPAGPHAVNVVLHTANAVLLFLLLESATGSVWCSVAVAGLFALHPINVESVAWIAERKNVLSMFFFLLALAAYGRYTRRPGIGRYLAVTFAYVFGLMTKPQVITFPFALLLLDYWPLYRMTRADGDGTNLHKPTAHVLSFWSLVREKVPWFVLSAASAVITMKVQADAVLLKLPLRVRFANAALSYAKYLEKAIWPANLAIVYPHPDQSISMSAVILSALAIIAFTVIAVLFRQHRPFFTGWFWFLGTLVPMIGLVQVGYQAMADRYAYIPLLGIFVIVCWGAAALMRIWRVPPALSVVGAAAVLVTLGAALHRQVSFWNDNVTLWAHTLKITDKNYIAEDNLATALIDKGRIEEAMPHLQRALRLWPDDPEATLNVATYEQMHGNYQTALDGYARVLQLTRNAHWVVTARVNRGFAYLSLNQYASARHDFEFVTEEQPTNSKAYRGLGLLEQRTGDIVQATTNYQRSVGLEPTPVGYLLLAQALEIGGHLEEAQEAQTRASRISRDLNVDIATMKLLLATY